MPKKRIILLTVWPVMAVLWMFVIYLFSDQPASKQNYLPELVQDYSQDELQSILPKWEFTYGEAKVTYKKPSEFIVFFLRKASHVVTYACLTTILLIAFRSFGVRTGMSMLLSVVIALTYAVLDEWHQTFVPGRTGHAIDVAVDAIGISLTILSDYAYKKLKMILKTYFR